MVHQKGLLIKSFHRGNSNKWERLARCNFKWEEEVVIKEGVEVIIGKVEGTFSLHMIEEIMEAEVEEEEEEAVDMMIIDMTKEGNC